MDEDDKTKRKKAARADAAAKKRLGLMEQFAPKGRREAVAENAARVTPTVAMGKCHECGGPRVSVCMCLLSESACANGHYWYRCKEHGRRVNRARAAGIPCGH